MQEDSKPEEIKFIELKKHILGAHQNISAS
jgi:hypothetical protein